MFSTSSPLSIPFDSEPSLLLQEIEKDDLPQKLLCKVNSVDAFGFKICFDIFISGNNFIERFFSPQEKVAVFFKELFGDLFDVKGIFKLCKSGVVPIISNNRVKLALCSMTIFILADQKRPSACRSEFFFDFYCQFCV